MVSVFEQNDLIGRLRQMWQPAKPTFIRPTGEDDEWVISNDLTFDSI
jgi:hypothetical protein